ncbi:DNA-processing protein DprA [Baekduia sp.]|jgi:DNA processing protein|uniref:DNA-processing protein DprA n=1 Tax=Baekduia sp. TaxID=2600305 RepID=UPI002DFBCEF8|nr:DNA-processing protein DprA [Baekduia sp.]
MSVDDHAVACAACLRRTWLLAQVAGGLEVAHSRRRPIRSVLALEEDALIDAVCGGTGLRERVAVARPTDLLAAAADAGLDVLCRHTAGYPVQLLDDAAPPAALFVRGGDEARARLMRLVGRAADDEDRAGRLPAAVAVVGTRRASPEGLEVARVLGRGLAGAGVTVVSGLALGVDSAAHAGAVDVCGPTVAVLAGGADVPYPRRKAGLYSAILAAGGAIVSEMPPGFRAFRWNFPARNRIIAALAPATIVVEAAERSGSLITAELALDLGRDVAAVPGPVLSWRSRGTNALLRDGATLIRDVQDALEVVLGIDGAAAAMQRAESELTAPPTALAPALRALLAAVEDGHDSVASLTRDPARAPAVRAGLAELELLGLLRRVSGGRVLRTTRAVAS